MLDAFIIDRIKKEKEQNNGQQVPLHIIVPPHQPNDEREIPETDEPSGRGCEVIDFTLSARNRVEEVLTLA